MSLWWAILVGYWVVLFVVHFTCSVVGSAHPVHPVCHVPSLAGAVVEVVLRPAVIWLLGQPSYLPARLSSPSSKRWAPTGLSPTLYPRSLVAGPSSTGTVGRSVLRRRRGTPGGWRCRRSPPGVGTAGPSAGDLLVGVGPRRRRVDNTRAVLYGDLEELWRRRTVARCGRRLLWRLLETRPRLARRRCWLWMWGTLDRPQRRDRVVSKGGSVDMVVLGGAHRGACWAAIWPTGPTGPLFLTR